LLCIGVRTTDIEEELIEGDACVVDRFDGGKYCG